MPLYTILVTDRNYVPVGELTNFGSFTFVSALNKLATCSFQIRLDNAQADRLALCDAYVKVYRDKVLKFVGPVVAAEEAVEGSTQAIQVTCADIGWILGKRLVGKSQSGTLFSAATDRAQIAKTLIDTVNTEAETGVSTTTHTLSAGSSTTYKAGPYKDMLSTLTELGGSLDGFDWRITPIENYSAGAVTGTKVGAVQAYPVIGTNKGSGSGTGGAFFEYGGGRNNVLQYKKTRTRDSQATRVFHLASDMSTVKSATNGVATSAWGLQEAVAQADLADATLRQSLVDEHVLVRGNPRDLVLMTPHIGTGTIGKVPQPFVDYDTGDTVTFRAVYGSKVRFSGQLRVYGISITIENETGFERVELVLEDDA